MKSALVNSTTSNFLPSGGKKVANGRMKGCYQRAADPLTCPLRILSPSQERGTTSCFNACPPNERTRQPGDCRHFNARI